MTAAVNSEVVAEPGGTTIHQPKVGLATVQIELTTHVGGANFAGVNHVESRACDVIGKAIEAIT